MKKILGIIVLGLLLSGNVYAASYVFKDNLYTDCDILTKKDPTSFQNIVFVKKETIQWWDRRELESNDGKVSTFTAFVFKAAFKNGKDVSIRVNSEFKTKKKAEKQALKYGRMAGQLPNFLRTNLKTITIHKGNNAWGGGNFDILIHISDQGAKGKCGEEVMMHESGHTSLDPHMDGSVNRSKWDEAIKADNKFKNGLFHKNGQKI